MRKRLINLSTSLFYYTRDFNVTPFLLFIANVNLGSSLPSCAPNSLPTLSYAPFSILHATFNKFCIKTSEESEESEGCMRSVREVCEKCTRNARVMWNESFALCSFAFATVPANVGKFFPSFNSNSALGKQIYKLRKEREKRVESTLGAYRLNTLVLLVWVWEKERKKERRKEGYKPRARWLLGLRSMHTQASSEMQVRADQPCVTMEEKFP